MHISDSFLWPCQWSQWHYSK